MKALVIHGPGKYRFEADWPEPQSKADWARVRVQHAGICGSDITRFATTGSYHHPMILGHEFSGVVDTPAKGSNRFKAGQRVAVLPIIPCGTCSGCSTLGPFHCNNYQFLGSRNDGGFAEYCLVPEQNLFPLPDSLDPRIGAFIEPIAVALHVLRRSGFQPGESAIVFGAGTIGILIALWLKIFGATRLAIGDIRADKLEMARSMGIDETFDAHRLSPDTEDEASNISGFDAAFEAAGSTAALLSAIGAVSHKGTITVVGREVKDVVVPIDIFEKLMRKEVNLHGCWGYNMDEDQSFVYEMLKRGRFPVTQLISHEINLEGAPEMIEKMIRKEMHYGKVMLEI